MLTNFKTVKQSIKRLKDMEQMRRTARSSACRRRKRSTYQREMAKLERSLGGIKDMNGLPDALFVIDVGYQKSAVTEANKLGIPVVGVVDTNHSPDGIDYVIPGQRRFEPRDPAVRARHRRRGPRRPQPVVQEIVTRRATSSSRSRTEEAGRQLERGRPCA